MRETFKRDYSPIGPNFNPRRTMDCNVNVLCCRTGVLWIVGGRAGGWILYCLPGIILVTVSINPNPNYGTLVTPFKM